MQNIIIFFGICVLITSCGVQENSHRKENSTISSVNIRKDSVDTSTAELPFIGIRDFETRPGVSGTGTPHRNIEIMKNGDVFFSFEQVNQADQETVTKGKYYAGKFKPFMKCYFKEWDNETMYFEITKDKIYQVDTNNKRLTNDECCGSDNFDLKDKCPCESIYSME